MRGKEGIAYADIDLGACVEPKQFHDVVGGYQRYDIFSLKVNRERHEPVVWDTRGGEQERRTEF